MEIYKKQPLGYQEQLDRLISRGLVVENKEKALHLLENLSYYRISAYFYPLLVNDKETQQFKEGSTFESAFKMYCFDRELRLLVFNSLEKIEISFRAKLTFTLSHKYDSFWFTYKKLFKNEAALLNSNEMFLKLYNDSTEDFVIKYKRKYLNNHLPSWMSLELTTFTHLSKIYSNLKDTAAKSQIAKSYGLPYQIFENWLLMLTYSRNICAHHSRYWNREFSIKVLKTKKELEYNWIDQTDIARNKSYIYLSIVKYLTDRVNPNNTFKTKLVDLFKKYDNIDFNKSMGFPKNWEEQKLWKG